MLKSEYEHKIFRAGIFLKGIYSFFELIAGIVLLFITSVQIYNLVHIIFLHELLEDAHDFVANFILNSVGSLSHTVQLFIAVYLIVHGLIKLGLVIALWKEKRAAYPMAIAIFGLFVIYQIYRFFLHHSHSVFLLLITDLDMLIINLTLIEYYNLRKHHKMIKTHH
ncbi:MAG TPA: DUF2127 domain-containing protein [Candidatus Omnitrophota bacterium]|nr:DUF2127 domain-containing protein [Candidatus Omnitrophota bacterium]